ncbi:MAG: M48 family metallopeptidase [Bacteroidota bacterium]
MKTKFLKAFAMVLLVSACAKVPITKRNQMNLLPESEMISMSLTSYSDFLKQNPPVNGGADAIMVKSVGSKIQSSVIQYMNKNGFGDRIKGYKWEYNLVNNPEVNAWCMPGGKVVVYSGLLPVTQNEQSLAIVMGHEIAHAVARHGNERMSQSLLASAGGMALDLYMTQKPEATRNLFMGLYGIGATGGILAYSRMQESEADKLGLVFAAMSGYDPHVAIAFWQRMAQSSKSGASSGIDYYIKKYTSTHPPDDVRIKDLQAYMPEAMKYYHPK